MTTRQLRAPQRITPSFAFSYVERALQEGLGRRAFGRSEMDLAVAFFGEPFGCVYCDSTDVRRWDHLISVFAGGETVIGNMVPACAGCDDSKRQDDFASWLHARADRGLLTAESADDRIRRLRHYAERFGYRPTPLDARLNADRNARLSELRSRASLLKRDIEEFLRTASQ